MESALSWIGDLMRGLGSLVPTWRHVEWQEAAAIVKRGQPGRELAPGVHWFWPFWSTIYTMPRVRQTINLPAQSLLTADSTRVVASGMVRYRIDDAVLALVDTHDVDRAVVDESLAVLCEFVTGRTLDQNRQDRQKVNTAVTLSVRSALREYGVYVLRAQLTDLATCYTLNHIGQARGTSDAREEA